MEASTSEILDAALALSEQERAEIACELLESLGPEKDDLLDDAWSQELDRRLAELRCGEGDTVSWSELKREH